MGRLEDLQRQFQEAKKAQEAILSKSDECMRWDHNKKAQVYDAVVPLIKSAVEAKIRSGKLDWNDLNKVVTEKLIKELFGPDAIDNIGQL